MIKKLGSKNTINLTQTASAPQGLIQQGKVFYMNDEGGNGRSGSHGSSGRSGSHGRSNGRGRGECKTELLQKRNVPFPFVVDWSISLIHPLSSVSISKANAVPQNVVCNYR